MHDHYIVCGYGRMGKFVCDDLNREGVPFVGIELRERQTAIMEDKGYVYLLGDASDESVLKSAGIDRAKGLITVLRSDADNLYVTLTARGLNNGLTIVSRAEGQASENKLKMAGADRVVSPHRMGARRITNILLHPAIVEFVDVAVKGLELEINELKLDADSPLVDKRLQDSQLREEGGTMVVAIKRADGTNVYSPTADIVLKSGDTLITIGRQGQLDASKMA